MKKIFIVFENNIHKVYNDVTERLLDMQEIENNAYFWQKLDTIFLSSTYTIDTPKGSTHKQYTNLIYPVDYGYLTDTLTTDQQPIRIYVGSIKTTTISAVAISADILKKDCEVKLLLGCTEKETKAIMQFLNKTEFQKALLIHRGIGIPSWAIDD